ncbi:nucleic acid-binding, OB-fold protein [Vibrio phage 1.244.A._10N.261.54.C3]|nr:nucleic acid-binding, OB-fold protein [Vibrio phage 1.244.A._10N.261.54.C3]AUR98708.1 nucleic acid-binding, OB-fold protein [Vibrio phage 1.255.O._10N.286.45.F1]
MSRIYEVVQDLGAARGINAKKAILSGLQGQDEADMQLYVHYAMDPRLSLYQTLSDELRVKLNGMQLSGTPKRDLLGSLEYIAGMATLGETRGDSGKMLISRVRSRLPSDQDRELFDLFIDRNIKVGLGVKSINSVWERHLAYSPYNRCKSATAKLWDKFNWARGVYSQLKSDGMFLNVRHEVVDGCIPVVEFTSREGNVLESDSLHGLREDVFDLLDNLEIERAFYLHGEALVYDPEGNLLPREQGNGKLNRIIQTGEDLDEGYTVKFHVWDIVDGDYFDTNLSKKQAQGVDYAGRFQSLEALMKEAGELQHITLQESKIVYSIEEAMAHFQEMMDRGEEGTVIKCPDGLWFDGDSETMLKLKLEVEFDMVVVGRNAGDANGKHADTFGSLQVESSCGLVAAGCSGLSDELRQEIHDNFELWEGSIATIRCNGIQENSFTGEKGEVKSVFLPRLVSERRLDKFEADSLEQMREIQAATIKNGGKPIKR